MDRTKQFLSMLTDEQREQLDSPPAMITHPQPHEANSQVMTTKFHKAMNMPAPSQLELSPSVSLRQLRLELMLEEFLECVEAFGFEMGTHDGVDFVPWNADEFDFRHIEGSRYDIVEAYDAVCDMDVINNGTAVALGFIVETGAHEVYCSNMTKLDESGKPIVNECQDSACEELNLSHDTCDDPEHLIDPAKPVGKILKPAHYTPANLTAILYSQLISES